MSETIRLGAENEDCDPPTGKILFVLQPLVQCQEYIKALTFCTCKHISIFLAGKAYLRDSFALMAVKTHLEFSGNTLVDQDPH